MLAEKEKSFEEKFVREARKRLFERHCGETFRPINKEDFWFLTSLSWEGITEALKIIKEKKKLCVAIYAEGWNEGFATLNIFEYEDGRWWAKISNQPAFNVERDFYLESASRVKAMHEKSLEN